jgi:hypothetical protein
MCVYRHLNVDEFFDVWNIFALRRKDREDAANSPNEDVEPSAKSLRGIFSGGVRLVRPRKHMEIAVLPELVLAG